MVTLIPTDLAMDRARRVPSDVNVAMDLPTTGSWQASGAFAPCGTTGSVVGTSTLSNHTTGTTGQFIDRFARHLGTRST